MAGTTGLGTSPASQGPMKTRKLLILQATKNRWNPKSSGLPPKRSTKKVQALSATGEKNGVAGDAPELRGVTPEG